MADAYEVHPYSIDKLKQLLAERSEKTSLFTVGSKLHSVYFEEYFGPSGVEAKTIVVECEYVDHDFMEDFAGYYIRCFRKYSHTCARLHFFNVEFEPSVFKDIITASNPEMAKRLQDAYLGFIVVRPIPKTIIGRTCLTTYPDSDGRRFFPIVRKYEANLFGLPLKVNTLAFQEQDSVVAACASSALWSVFHGTGVLFHHSIPSPVEITKAASRYLPFENRTFPNHGLNGIQMSHAIRNVGLEPLYFNAEDELTLKSFILGYVGGKIPMILGIQLWDMSDSAVPTFEGLHAVAVTGFSLPSNRDLISDPDTGTQFTSSAIDQIYVHDDQVGPFARMTFDGIRVCRPTHEQTPSGALSLHTSWKGRDGIIGSIRAVPYMIMIPLYHKIRVPIGSIMNAVGSFDALLNVGRETKFIGLQDTLQWAIRLTTVNEWKNSLRSALMLSEQQRHELLCESAPKYLWRATASNNGSQVIDLLFDATDIEQGEIFLNGIVYDQAVSDDIRSFFSRELGPADEQNPAYSIVRWFHRH